MNPSEKEKEIRETSPWWEEEDDELYGGSAARECDSSFTLSCPSLTFSPNAYRGPRSGPHLTQNKH